MKDKAKKKVVKHLKKKVVAKKKAVKHKESPKAKAKVTKVMREYKNDELHSGSKKGPKVSSRKQAIAIALSEAGLSKKKNKPAKKKKK